MPTYSIITKQMTLKTKLKIKEKVEKSDGHAAKKKNVDHDDYIDRYEINGKFFSFGDKLKFQDMDGNVLLKIEQELVAATPTYKIIKPPFDDGKKRIFAIMSKEKKERTSDANFFLDVPGDNDYKIEGNVKEREYVFTRTKSKTNKPVAIVSKKALGLGGDAYNVRIIEDEDYPSILAACIIMDQILKE